VCVGGVEVEGMFSSENQDTHFLKSEKKDKTTTKNIKNK
jgi:hypothetical protein